MKQFFRDGRGMAVGQRCVLPLIKLIGRYILHNFRFLHYGRNDVVSVIFCVLFSGPDLLGTGALAQSQHRAASRINFGDKASLISPARAQEAGGLNKIQPLKVGDQIPDELWDMPLKVVNHPEGKEYIRLSDYRDKKLIVLEFWGTWCGSCIAALPLAKNVQNEFVKDLLVIPITFEPAGRVTSFVAKNEIARNVNLWSVVEDSIITNWITKYTYPHFTWIADGKILSHSSESALKIPYVKEYLNAGTIRWVEKVNLDKDGLFLSSLGDLQHGSSSFFYAGYLDGAGRGFGAMPFQGERTNYYFVNYSPRKVHEWFLKKLARERGEILTEIAYAPAFRNSATWQMYNEGYISLQLIANKELPLDAVFRQFQAMTSSRLELDSDGHYTLSTEVKGAGR